MKLLTTALLLLAPLLLSACTEIKVSDEDVVIATETQVLAALSDPKVVIVDVRKPDAYAAGHIPGAVNIFVPDIRASDGWLSNAKRIIVYASGFTDTLSGAAAKKMLALGYANVEEFKGGMEIWKSSGQQVVTSLPPKDARPETTK